MHRLPQFLAVFAIAVLAALTAPEARADHVLANSGSSGFDGWCKENYTYSEIRNVNNLYGGSGGRRQRACKIPNTYRTVNYEYCLHKPFPGDYGAEIFVYDLSGVTPIPVNPLNNAADHPLCEEVIPDSETARKLAAKFTASNRADANRPGPITRVTLVPGGIEIGGWTLPRAPRRGNLDALPHYSASPQQQQRRQCERGADDGIGEHAPGQRRQRPPGGRADILVSRCRGEPGRGLRPLRL